MLANSASPASLIDQPMVPAVYDADRNALDDCNVTMVVVADLKPVEPSFKNKLAVALEIVISPDEIGNAVENCDSVNVYRAEPFKNISTDPVEPSTCNNTFPPLNADRICI